MRYFVCLVLLFGLACSKDRDALQRDELTVLRPLLKKRAELAGFLAAVKTEIRDHRWKALLARVDKSHYQSQVNKLGMRHPQYLAELLGLNMADNNIRRPGSKAAILFRDLDRVRGVRYTGHRRFGPLLQIDGKVRLEGGRVLSLTLILVRRESSWYISGPRG